MLEVMSQHRKHESRRGRRRKAKAGAIAASGGVLAGVEALRRARKRSHTSRNEELGTHRWRIERHHVKQDLHEGKWDSF